MNDLVLASQTKPAVAVGLTTKPVYIDGLTSTLTYVILAVRESERYNCICLSHYGTLKFYPNYEFWGLTAGSLHHMGLTRTYDRAPYQGVHGASTDGVKKALQHVRDICRGAAVVPDDLIYDALHAPLAARGESRKIHPAARGQAVSPLLLPTAGDLQHLLGYDPRKPLLLEAPASTTPIKSVTELVSAPPPPQVAHEAAAKSVVGGPVRAAPGPSARPAAEKALTRGGASLVEAVSMFMDEKGLSVDFTKFVDQYLSN